MRRFSARTAVADDLTRRSCQITRDGGSESCFACSNPRLETKLHSSCSPRSVVCVGLRRPYHTRGRSWRELTPGCGRDGVGSTNAPSPGAARSSAVIVGMSRSPVAHKGPFELVEGGEKESCQPSQGWRELLVQAPPSFKPSFVELNAKGFTRASIDPVLCDSRSSRLVEAARRRKVDHFRKV